MAVKNLEFLNRNSTINYPIKEGLPRTDTSGTFTIPNSLIVDAVFSIEDISTQFFVKEIRFFEENIIINISNENNVFVGSINVDVATHTTDESYPVIGKGDFKFIQGKLVIGDLSNVQALGKFEFTIENSRFEDTVLIPSLRGVSSLSAFGSNVLLVNNVKLRAGINARIRTVESDNTIFIDAIDGEGLGRECVCEEVDEREPVKTINGNGPDESGNYNIRGVGCIQVEDIENGIIIRNTCEDVCCDCDDVNAIIALLNNRQTQIDALETRVLSLENA